MSVPLAFGWRHILFSNWRVDAEVVEAHLPDALSVQTFDDTGWLSVIPFLNVDTRPRGLPSSLGVTLPELNLRTYVTCGGEPGIYFFSLDMESVLGVLGARLTHHLPYYYARMDAEEHGGRMQFSSRRLHPGARPVHFEASYAPTGEAFEADPGSLAEFLTERRRLYTQAQDGSVRFTDVDHERWSLYDVDRSVAENTLFEANGFDHPGGEPVCYYSPGVSVTTTPSERWASRSASGGHSAPARR